MKFLIRLLLAILPKLLAWWAERAAVQAEEIAANVRAEKMALEREYRAARRAGDLLMVKAAEDALAEVRARELRVEMEAAAAREEAKRRAAAVDHALRRETVERRLP